MLKIIFSGGPLRLDHSLKNYPKIKNVPKQLERAKKEGTMINLSFYKKNKIYYLQIYFEGKRIQKSTGKKLKVDAESFAKTLIEEFFRTK